MFGRKKAMDNTRAQHILNENMPFAVREAYKYTSTGLRFCNVKDGCNIIVFTSAMAGEGKTVTCINMAISLAESGKRVLLVDSDMRKPQVAQSMKLSGVPGLSELLSGVVDISTDVQRCIIKTECDNLDVIPAGSIPPNPAELISCERADKLFGAMSEKYDYVFVDTPPCMVVSDALLYKPHADGYVVVVRSDVSKRENTVKLAQRFEQIGARILGFVLNDKVEYRKKYKQYGMYDTV